MTHARARFLLGAIAVTGLALGVQAQDRLPRFEVATVKENTSGDTRMQTVTRPGGRFVAGNAPLKLLIADAFIGPEPMAVERVIGGPEWLATARYDITAKATTEFELLPGGPPRDMLLMIRALLEDRFKIKTHRETREFPIFELVLARPDGTLGPKIRRSDFDCDALAAAIRAGAPPARQPGERPQCRVAGGPALLQGGAVTMDQFVTTFIRPLGRPVVNKTGLTGRFDFDLTFAPLAPPPPDAPPIDPSTPTLFQAVQEQLGLKLEAARGPLDVVVIDSIERPTPD